jgi:16S rRNA pseudouridine516 synthase
MKTRRLDQLLASLGYGSRREVKGLIKARRIAVAGTTVTDPGCKTVPEQIALDGEPIDTTAMVCILMHKPAGYVCSHDPAEGPRVYDLLPPRWMQRNPLPATAGRLDKDTTGALLITDQHPLIHRLTAPKHKAPKVYRAQLSGPVQSHWQQLLASGTLLLDGETQPCAPAELEVLTSDTVRLTLTEGRYHQVKRMFTHLGAPVLTLHRESFAGLTCDHLAAGTWEVLPAAVFIRLLAPGS